MSLPSIESGIRVEEDPHGVVWYRVWYGKNGYYGHFGSEWRALEALDHLKKRLEDKCQRDVLMRQERKDNRP